MRKRVSLLSALALILLSAGLIASAGHSHPFGSPDADHGCGVCKWVRVIGAASPVPEFSLQATLQRSELVAPPLASFAPAPAVAGSASRAPPAS